MIPFKEPHLCGSVWLLKANPAGSVRFAYDSIPLRHRLERWMNWFVIHAADTTESCVDAAPRRHQLSLKAFLLLAYIGTAITPFNSQIHNSHCLYCAQFWCLTCDVKDKFPQLWPKKENVSYYNLSSS